MVKTNIIEQLQKTHSKIFLNVLRQICIRQIQSLRQFLQSDWLTVIRHDKTHNLIHSFILNSTQRIVLLHPFFHNKIRCNKINELIINAVLQCNCLSFCRLIQIEYLANIVSHLLITLRLFFRRITPEKRLFSSEYHSQHRIIDKQTSEQNFIFRKILMTNFGINQYKILCIQMM